MAEQPPDPDFCASCGNQFPAGQVCLNCAPPDLETILRVSQGITADVSSAIRTLAQVHADWREAWQATGKFTEQEAFELVRILVAASAGGVRCLNL